MDAYQKYIAMSRYARWLPEQSRRETWEETVQRYIQYFQNNLQVQLPTWALAEFGELQGSITELEVMPSMRCLMTAGPALDRDNVAGYNCAYAPVDSVRFFDEMMYILMCGTGVGFSVERQYIAKLPEIAEKLHDSTTCVKVRDSKKGWAIGFRELLSLLYAGQVPSWDVSSIRPAGAPLKVFGGRASGPEPLVELFEFTVALFKRAAGRKLTSIECHDLCCKIASIVVVGGVRRSALISLSNLTDDRVRRAKHGQWWVADPHRGLANNSACYTEKPDFEAFLNEMVQLYESKSGERGIFSRPASKRQAARNGRRDSEYDFGTNPCSEIILRPNQFCNLSEVVVRSTDSVEDLKRKVRNAAILGTLQSTLTDFSYIRAIWKRNTEDERLLGVSLTGIMDHPILSGRENADELPTILELLKGVAVETNAKWADALGIPHSAAITCVKPSGTVSQLVDSASGIHARYSEYYIRRVRADVKDPLARLMQDYGVANEMDRDNPNVVVFSFPKKSPTGAVTVKDITAIDQLNLWKIYQQYWCEHKPSCTVYYDDSEYLDVCSWVYKHFDDVSGISFLPRDNGTYVQAPYEEITEEVYNTLVEAMPAVDIGALHLYEVQDNTTSSQELACTGATGCEIV